MRVLCENTNSQEVVLAIQRMWRRRSRRHGHGVALHTVLVGLAAQENDFGSF